ncbi:MAG: hypothetical protein BGO52_17395 [Sphingobacteriales bacterium 44-61]|nr:MAG: hypothetical protein BGO52_17395 [Sphingobacteriales bacterium 44-61]
MRKIHQKKKGLSSIKLIIFKIANINFGIVQPIKISMKNIYYNGLVTYRFSILVKSIDHQTCLSLSKKIKDYLSAWSFGNKYLSEHKSAKKGDILEREIQAGFEDYPATVIAFREGLRCICFHYDLFTKDTSVKIIDHGTEPKDSHVNILK